MRHAFVAFGVVLICVIAGLTKWQHDQSAELRKYQVRACERGKLDRADNAASWAAHREYMISVLAAASVKQDVKTAAERALQTHLLTAERLRVRSMVDCEDPAASTGPAFEPRSDLSLR